MVIDKLQLEFPFTREGALDAYNQAQLGYFRKRYNELIATEKNPHYIPEFTDYIAYAIPVLAPEFAKQYSRQYFGNSVEAQNDRVWDAWIDNRLHDTTHPIYKTLEQFLQEGGHLDGFNNNTDSD